MNNRSTREFVERLGHIRLEDEARARILDNMTENAFSDTSTLREKRSPAESEHVRLRPSVRPISRKGSDSESLPFRLLKAVAQGASGVSRS